MYTRTRTHTLVGSYAVAMTGGMQPLGEGTGNLKGKQYQQMLAYVKHYTGQLRRHVVDVHVTPANMSTSHRQRCPHVTYPSVLCGIFSLHFFGQRHSIRLF